MDYLFDVFLSHNSKDKEFVREIARLLRDRGLRPWLDEERLIPVERWQDKLARGIRESATCAMFLGPNSIGDWQQEELNLVQNRAARSRDYRLTPVLLPGLTDLGLIPPFLQSRTRVDYRSGIDDQRALHLLICSINGTPPEQKSDGEVSSNAETRFRESKKDKESDFSESKPVQKQEISVQENWGLLNSGTIIINNNLGSDKAEPEKGEIDRLSQREKEIAYLEMLRGEEKLDRKKYYTPLSGQLVPVIDPQYEYIPFQPIEIDFEDEHHNGPKRFTDAAGEILRLKRAVVLGEPGAGKTTTLWKLAGDLIEQVEANPKAPLPLLIRLGRWIEETEPFTDFLRRQMKGLGPILDQLLAHNRAVLLLDGLNEVPTSQRRKKTVEIRKLLSTWPEVKCIISCRQLDYDESDLQMDCIEIVPLDPIRIKKFVCGYLGDKKGEQLFWKLAGGTAQEIYEQLRTEYKVGLEALPETVWVETDCPRGIYSWTWKRWIRERENPSSLLALARNPFMLTMLYPLYDKKGTIPENRGRLFDLFVRELLKREKVAPVAQDPILKKIGLLAYEMQTRRTSGQEGDALTMLPRSEVLKTLDECHLGISVRASLLSSGEEVRFTHQLLQEYFAARNMDEEINGGRLKASDLWPARAWWERNNWEVTTTLLAGFYNNDCTPIIDWIADANPEVAAMCIKRSGANCPQETLEKMRSRWLPRLTDLKRDKDPRARAAVGRALGMTGLDNRKGVGTKLDGRGRELPDIDWIEIQGGDFLFGKNNERRTVGGFAISRYPVTYQQFQVFIDDPEGIRDKRWFEGLACRDEEHQPGEQRFPYDNHPRERVSWYQAVAFCRWLSWRFGGGYDLNKIDEWKVRLPTELEWERAARGLDGRIYPYGNEFDPTKGNIYETGIGRTSAVGIFPEGASPDGVLDMSGNVWQWCLNPHKSSEIEAVDIDLTTDDRRPLRGGSWDYVPDVARAVFRRDVDPNARDVDVGLRLVSVVRPPS